MNRQSCFIPLVAMCFCMLVMPAVGQDASLQTPESGDAPISISVVEADSMLMQGADRNSATMRMSLKLRVRNESDKPVRIQRSQFVLSHQGKPFEAGLYESSPALESQDLQPGSDAEGFIWFVGVPHDQGEVPLELTWDRNSSERSKRTPPFSQNGTGRAEESSDEKAAGIERKPDGDESASGDSGPAVQFAVHPILRKLNQVDLETLGPDNCLTRIRVHRTQDVIATWYMSETLLQLSREGRQRVLIISQSDQLVTMMDEYITWLSGIVDSPETQSVTASLLPRIDARFKFIGVAGIPQAANRRFYGGRRALQMYDSVDDAIFESLAPVYRFVPVPEAMPDLKSPVAGVRRAAVAGIADRVSSEQAEEILKMARTEDEQVQLQLIQYLNLIPGGKSTGVLQQLALSENAKVSTAAVQSLCACPDDAAVVAMADIWQASAAKPELRSSVLAAIVKHPDERWVPLARDYVDAWLKTANGPAAPEVRPASIAGALGLLRDLERIQMVNVIAGEIASIRDPELQDVLLEFLMSVDFPDRSEVVHNVVNQRITEKKFSTVILRAATLFPDSAWTLGLVEAGRQKQNPAGYENTLRPALACANDVQLQMILDGFPSLPKPLQVEVLNHASRTSYPGWQSLASVILANRDRFAQEAIGLLVLDASDESLRVLQEQLLAYVKDLEGTKDASVDGPQFFVRLGHAVATFSDPECRRTINRLQRDPNDWVAEQAVQFRAYAYRMSPAIELIRQGIEARRAGKNDESRELLKKQLEADPFLADSYVSRASEHMHAQRFQESMADLQTADRLSPENVEVLSMIALVRIRLGETEAGLKLADEVIAMASKDWTGLYNGACSYSRAVENDISEDRKKSCADMAIQLLERAASLKFDDHEHMLKDADLTAIHDHAKWLATVELVKAQKTRLEEAP
ncbi:MAG: hypothetical protein ACK58L_11645 [Planctomycetota bacterium]